MQVQILMETQENIKVISIPKCNASASTNACVFAHINILTICETSQSNARREGGTPLFGLNSYVQLNRVWFLGSPVLTGYTEFHY